MKRESHILMIRGHAWDQTAAEGTVIDLFRSAGRAAWLQDGEIDMNVFTRYVLSFTFPWAEEIPVDCFVWTIFLGAAGAFKHKMLMGVDFLFHFVKGKTKKVLEIISSALVLLIATTMLSMRIPFPQTAKNDSCCQRKPAGQPIVSREKLKLL